MGEMAADALAEEEAIGWAHFDRRFGMGGSDVGVMLGLSPYRSEWDLWLEKTHDPAWRPSPDTAAKRLGKLLEPVVGQLYFEKTGRAPSLHGSTDPNDGESAIWHPNGIIFGHLDGDVTIDSPDGHEYGIFEAKVPRNARDWAEGVPPYYEAQALSNLSVVPDAQWVDIAVLFRDTAECEVFRIERDQPKIDALVRRVEEWWDLRVMRREAPPLDASIAATQWVNRRYWEPSTDDIMPFDADLETAAIAYISTHEAIGRLEETKGRLRNIIADKMGEYPRAEGAGWHVIFKRTKGTTSVAWKEVAASLRALIEQYRATPSRAIAARMLKDADLDAIQSLYTTVGDGNRPVLVKREEKF